MVKTLCLLLIVVLNVEAFAFFYPRSVFTIVYKCQSMENKDKCIKKQLKNLYKKKENNENDKNTNNK